MEISNHLLKGDEEISQQDKLYEANSLSEKDHDADQDQIIEILQQINNEYKASIQKARHTLLSLNLAPDQLSDDVRKVIKTAIECSTWETDQISCDDRLRKAEHSKETARVKTTLDLTPTNRMELEQKVAALATEYALSSKEYDVLHTDSINADKMSKIYEGKEQHYDTVFLKYQNEISASGITDTGLYKSMLDKFAEITLVKSEVSQLNAKLEKYNNLPPNLAAAEEMLLKAKCELDELTLELKTIIHNDVKRYGD